MIQALIPDFQLIFNNMPGNILVMSPNPPFFTILGVSDQLLEITNMERELVVGRSIFDVYPKNPDFLTANGPISLKKSLETVMETKLSDKFSEVRYDVPNDTGTFEERYWTSENTPVLHSDGSIQYILQITNEVTDQVKTKKIEDDLKEIESKYSVFMQAPVVVCIVTGPQNILQQANYEANQFLGQSQGIIGKSLLELLPSSESIGLAKILDKVRKTGQVQHIKEYPLQHHKCDGQALDYFNLTFQPYFDTKSKSVVAGVICVAHDVTDEVLIRKELEAAEYRYRTLIEEAPIATALYTGSDIRIQYANDIMLSYWGKDTSLIGKPFRIAIPELEGQPFPDLLEKVYNTGEEYIGTKEKAFLEIDGELKGAYFNFTYKPLFDKQGKVYAIHHTAIDVTDEVLAQQQLEKSTAELNMLSNAMPQLVWIADANGKVKHYNDRIYDFYGISKDADGSWITQNYLSEEDEQDTLEAWKTAVTEGSVYEIEHRLRMKDGSLRWHLSRALPQFNDEGEIIKWFGTATDVQKQKEYEEALRQSQARLQAIFEATPECIKIVSPDGKIQFINHSGLEMLESEKELIGVTSVVDVIAEEYKEAWLDNHNRICAGESLTWEFDVVGLKGTRRQMETNAVPLHTAEGIMHLGVTRDISERRKSDAALKESEEQFRMFANNIQNLAWMAKPDGWIYWYNQRWFEYTGTTLDEMNGWGWAKVHHPEHVDRVVTYLKEAWNKGETWELTFPLRGADGQYQWFLTRAYAVKNTEGKVVRWIGTNTNVNEQKKAEEALEQKNNELIHINNDLDNFVYTASHDLRTPIANIEGLLWLLTEDLNSGKFETIEAQHIISLMQDSVVRFKKTIDHLNDVVKLQQENSIKPVQINVLEVVEDVIHDLETMITSSGATLTLDLNEDETIRFSEKNLRSIVYNLISNAIKYRSLEREPLINISYSTVANHTVLTVQDNGLGMKASQKRQLFSMFKRFHDHVEGSGIGLYMVKKIVENAGGQIKVETDYGIGTTFKVYFKK